ncbi:hypothetical protein E1B28_010714 [Marasmius oreades]|uniref:Uncharacterized protein n=1 Tax=Marasmius oreades TaxID=181124 RepID=A0A9P7RZ71_9AGAR|nr:uncharacterized protein E1B28_010714 [Marasmius oreades]KAG7091693.1 hypothetical protein E1B28_010714 [Marasmius oreades]
MFTLDQLNGAILADIFSMIHDSSRHTLFSLLRVNGEVYHHTLPLIYQQCTFDFTQAVPSGETNPFLITQKKLNKILEADSSSIVLRSVRKIVLRSNNAIWAGNSDDGYPYVPSENEVYDKWSSLVKFVSRASHLKELVFDCRERVPLILLETLQNFHPACRLHVRNWTRLSSDTKVGDPYEEALARSPCLRSIHILSLTGGSELNLDEAAFQRILALSPHLESFTYLTQDVGRSCVRYDFGQTHRQEAPKFSEATVRKDMKTIRWGKSEPVYGSGSRGFLDRSMIEHWGAFMNFQTVQMLDLGWVQDPEVLEYIMTRRTFEGVRDLSFKLVSITGLDSVSVEQRLRDAVNRFLSSFTRLESLSIDNYHRRIDLGSLLASHGESLRSLSLRYIEEYRARPVLTLEDLHLIRTSASHLETLGIDINFTPKGKYESEAYEVLGSFHNLRTLNVYYNIKAVDETFGEEVYWKVAKTPASKLEEVNLYVQELPESPLGGRIVWMMDAIGHGPSQAQHRTFHMRRCERDDMRHCLQSDGV